MGESHRRNTRSSQNNSMIPQYRIREATLDEREHIYNDRRTQEETQKRRGTSRETGKKSHPKQRRILEKERALNSKISMEKKS